MTNFSRVERQERVKWTVLVPGVYVCAYVVSFFLRPAEKDVGSRMAPFSWGHSEYQLHTFSLIRLQSV